MTSAAAGVRVPAVAGRFYPASADAVTRQLDTLLDTAQGRVQDGTPVGIIAPHAGWMYSGAVAAAAFSHVAVDDPAWARAVVVGPSHYVPVAGVAVPSATAFATPLGELPVDRDTCDRLRDLPGVVEDDAAHAREHSLEVELPFLQHLFGTILIVPLAVGDADPAVVADVLAEVVDDDTLLVVSTDLSHYLPEPVARTRDQRTAAAITARRWQDIDIDDACGHAALRGALHLAGRHDLAIERVMLATSADAGAGADRVVGYGAFTLG